jgi:hypothetical protein
MEEQVQHTERGPLGKMVEELERQRDSKRDFVADSRHLAVVPSEDGSGLSLVAGHGSVDQFLPEPHKISNPALAQFGERAAPSIPVTFLRNLVKEKPDAAATLVSRLIRENGKQQLVRCLDGRVRALLSNKFRIMDHYDVAFAAMAAARDHGGEIIESSLNETHMRMKFTSREVFEILEQERVKVIQSRGQLGSHTFLKQIGFKFSTDFLDPNAVRPTVTISNSETGHGGYHVQLGMMLDACINLAIMQKVTSSFHIGGKLEAGMYSDKTIELDARAIMAKAKDAVAAAFIPETFRGLVDRARVAQDTPVFNAIEAVDNFVKANDVIGESHKEDLLRHFTDDYDRTAFGFSQAVSRLAQDTSDANDADAIERLAGEIINKPEMVLAKAA